MALAVVRFAREHAEAAAELLAARHRADRLREPCLPAVFERVEAARRAVRATTDWRGASGVAALRAGELVGFLIGAAVLPPPTSRGALFLHPRSAVVPYSGHAVDPRQGSGLYGEMYRALAPAWVDTGYLAHYVHLAASDRETLDAWHGLGFGHDVTAAVRDTSPVPSATAGVEMRRAGLDDLDTVARMAEGLHRFHALPPMYLPYLPETEPDERRYHEKLLADSAGAHWLAYREGRAVGMTCLEPPPPFVSPLLLPERCIYLLQGYAEPEARGGGIGTALLARAMTWAREAGHAHCLLHFHAANLVSRRFWLASGFGPVELRLHRRIDERIAWDGSRAVS